MDHDGPPIIPIRPIFSDPPSFRCPTSEFSCVEILRGVQPFLRLVARNASEWILTRKRRQA